MAWGSDLLLSAEGAAGGSGKLLGRTLTFLPLFSTPVCTVPTLCSMPAIAGVCSWAALVPTGRRCSVNALLTDGFPPAAHLLPSCRQREQARGKTAEPFVHLEDGVGSEWIPYISQH